MTGKHNFTLEEIFSSRGRTKIIKILVKYGELNISKIIEKTNSNHEYADIHLKALTDAKILQEKRYGRIRIFRLRDEDIRVRAIKHMISTWENFNTHQGKNNIRR